MKNLHDVWSARFVHYITEVQKYLRYVFTGHIAIVFVFIIGAGGYQYSEWLKVAPSSFPAEWLVSIMLGLIVAFSRPTTLLREPDQVYLLPLESKMSLYFNKALRWTFWSQILVVVIPYIITIPLLKTVTTLTVGEIWTGLGFAIILKFINVQLEFFYRYSARGAHVWMDRLWRTIASVLTIFFALTASPLISIIGIAILLFCLVLSRKDSRNETVPYEHFVKIEQNRMMGFYRFANYFTDVPHLRGSIHRRAWLDWLYSSIKHKKGNTQLYLVFRTFVRTDDHFYLWVRLTVISAVIAAFVDIPVVTWIVAGALAFATVIQLKQALLTSHEFRMDMLYPVPDGLRLTAVRKVLRYLLVAQAIVVALSSVGQSYFFVTPVIILVIGELTERLTKGEQ